MISNLTIFFKDLNEMSFITLMITNNKRKRQICGDEKRQVGKEKKKKCKKGSMEEERK